jgi:alcohol dehydrogenase
LHAIRLTVTYLPQAVANGSDLRARGQMQVAALLAGWAFSNAMVGLVHALAHSLGAVCRIPHGLANALILPQAMRYNLTEVPELMMDIAAAMGISIEGMDALEAGKAAADEMEAFIKQVGLTRRLKDLGVSSEALKHCSELSLSDGSIVYNPRMVMDAEDILDIYMKLY